MKKYYSGWQQKEFTFMGEKFFLRIHVGDVTFFKDFFEKLEYDLNSYNELKISVMHYCITTSRQINTYERIIRDFDNMFNISSIIRSEKIKELLK
jgi:hypothetical protein